MNPKQRRTRALIAIAIGLIVGFAWGIVSSWLFPSDLVIFWTGIVVNSIVALIIAYRYLPTTAGSQQNNDE